MTKGVKARLAAANYVIRDSNISKYKGFCLLFDNVDEEELNKDNAFNPNQNNLYDTNIDFTRPIVPNSSLYFLELIPDKKTNGKTSLAATFYLLGFVNWAIYYYNRLTEEYNQKKRYKTNDEKQSSYETAKSMAILIESIAEEEYTLEDIQTVAIIKDSKKNFKLNPKTFIILCQLFARGWYDQHFFANKHKKGTIEFAHYLSCYIQKDMTAYNAKNSNIDSSLKKLFSKVSSKTLDFNLFDFHILAKQEKHSSKKEKFSYSISINQYGCKHTFYRYAQLHNERHIKTFH